jgi:hypothetical protein
MSSYVIELITRISVFNGLVGGYLIVMDLCILCRLHLLIFWTTLAGSSYSRKKGIP